MGTTKSLIGIIGLINSLVLSVMLPAPHVIVLLKSVYNKKKIFSADETKYIATPIISNYSCLKFVIFTIRLVSKLTHSWPFVAPKLFNLMTSFLHIKMLF